MEEGDSGAGLFVERCSGVFIIGYVRAKIGRLGIGCFIQPVLDLLGAHVLPSAAVGHMPVVPHSRSLHSHPTGKPS